MLCRYLWRRLKKTDTRHVAALRCAMRHGPVRPPNLGIIGQGSFDQPFLPPGYHHTHEIARLWIRFRFVVHVISGFKA